jgi:membrane associated rhomboid family serine protease
VIIPIGIDQPVRRQRSVTILLVILNVALFLGFLVTGRDNPDFLNVLVDRYGISAGHTDWWRFVTYSLIHAGGWHLFGNMIILWTFGPFLEDRLGHVGFLALYIAGSVGAGLAHIATTVHPAVGASGAVSAVTGAFLVLAPLVHVRLFVFFILIGVFEIPAFWFIGFAIAKDFIGLNLRGTDNVAHMAHLGGVGIGMIVAFLLLATGILKRQPFDLLGIFKHAKRRSEFKAAFDERKKAAAPRSAPSSAEEAAALAARAEVSRLLGEDRLDDAAAAYLRYLEKSPSGTMPARQQLAVANQLFKSGRREEAFRAYELFVKAYPRSRETPGVKLLAALGAARYLSKPERARELIAEAMPGLHGEDRLLAEELLAEIEAKKTGTPAA